MIEMNDGGQYRSSVRVVHPMYNFGSSESSEGFESLRPPWSERGIPSRAVNTEVCREDQPVLDDGGAERTPGKIYVGVDYQRFARDPLCTDWFYVVQHR